jgi:hypothetical protein
MKNNGNSAKFNDASSYIPTYLAVYRHLQTLASHPGAARDGGATAVQQMYVNSFLK